MVGRGVRASGLTLEDDNQATVELPYPLPLPADFAVSARARKVMSGHRAVPAPNSMYYNEFWARNEAPGLGKGWRYGARQKPVDGADGCIRAYFAMHREPDRK